MLRIFVTNFCEIISLIYLLGVGVIAMLSHSPQATNRVSAINLINGSKLKIYVAT